MGKGGRTEGGKLLRVGRKIKERSESKVKGREGKTEMKPGDGTVESIPYWHVTLS
jgi:hypothetical protein